MDNIYKRQEEGILTDFDKQIVNSPYFENVIKNSEFKDLEELKIFFDVIKLLFNNCENNKINKNSLFPIDPYTGEDIDINNFLKKNGICYNKDKDVISPFYDNKSDIWKKLMTIMSIGVVYSITDKYPGLSFFAMWTLLGPKFSINFNELDNKY